MARKRRFTPGTQESPSLTLLQDPAVLKPGIGQPCGCLPQLGLSLMLHGGKPANIQTVCSSLVQGEVALGLGDLEVLLGV